MRAHIQLVTNFPVYSLSNSDWRENPICLKQERLLLMWQPLSYDGNQNIVITPTEILRPTKANSKVTYLSYYC